MNNTHLILIQEMRKGHKQLRELTKVVNRRTKKKYLESTVSARIRDLKGYYETLDIWKGRTRNVFYIAKPGAIKEVRKLVA